MTKKAPRNKRKSSRPPKRKGPAQLRLGGGEDPVIKGGAPKNREFLANGEAEKRDTLRWPAELRRRYLALAKKRGVSFNVALVAGLTAGIGRAFRKAKRKTSPKASTSAPAEAEAATA